jgi:thiosulfate dehydrogenase [quinone] large subunit
MIVSFLESFKYVGHLFPVVLLRVFLGWYYFKTALIKYGGDYLFRPRLADEIANWLPSSNAPLGYKAFIETFVIPNWQFFAYGLTGLEFAVAFSYLFGLTVRPIGLIAAFITFNLAMLSGPVQEPLYRTFFVIHLTLAWLGAGRCFGIDYYFYKRQRGIWW